jgi:hypothetical protein
MDRCGQSARSSGSEGARSRHALPNGQKVSVAVERCRGARQLAKVSRGRRRRNSPFTDDLIHAPTYFRHTHPTNSGPGLRLLECQRQLGGSCEPGPRGGRQLAKSPKWSRSRESDGGWGALPSRHHHIASHQLQPFSIIALGGCLPLPHRPHPPFSRNLGGSADNRLPPQVASFHLHLSTLASPLDPSTDFAETPQTSTRPALLLFSDSYLISASPFCRLHSGSSPPSAGGSLCLHALSVGG